MLTVTSPKTWLSREGMPLSSTQTSETSSVAPPPPTAPKTALASPILSTGILAW